MRTMIGAVILCQKLSLVLSLDAVSALIQLCSDSDVPSFGKSRPYARPANIQ